jgi:hypothetical protein
MYYHVSTFDWIKALEREKPVSLNRDAYDGSGFFHPGSRVKKAPDPQSGSATLNLQRI